MKLKDNDILNIDDIINRGCCTECGKRIKWEVSFLDDVLSFGSVCCNLIYNVQTNIGKVSIDFLYGDRAESETFSCEKH